MPLFSTPAIILGTLKLGDADKLITAYTLARGRFKGVAAGARRVKSRFGASLEPFTFCHLTATEKGGERLARIYQADIVRSFQTLREDWEGLSLGAQMLRMVERVTPEGDPNSDIFQLLRDGLQVLEDGLKEKRDREMGQAICFTVFSFRLVACSGYQPLWDHCLKCRAELNDHQAYFSASEGGCLCRICAGGRQNALPPISRGTLAYLRFLKKVEGDQVYRLKPSALIRKEVSLLFSRHLAYISGKRSEA